MQSSRNFNAKPGIAIGAQVSYYNEIEGTLALIINKITKTHGNLLSHSARSIEKMVFES